MGISRILIVGLGSIGRRHLLIAKNLYPGSDIRVLRHKLSNERIEHSNGSFFNINDAIKFNPEIAIIATPAPYHLDIANTLMTAGVHVLVEKPLTNSIDEAKTFLESVKNIGAVLAVGYNLRHLPSLNFFRDYIRDCRIGRILSVRCEVGKYLPAWRPQSDYRNAVSARQELGGGVLLELSHELDYLRWIFGEIEWVNAVTSRQSGLEINVEDVAHIIMGFSVDKNLQQLIGSVNLDFIRHDDVRYCYAIGEHGTLRWDGINGLVQLLSSKDNSWQELFAGKFEIEESYQSEWINFIKSIEGKDSKIVDGLDGLKTLELVHAIRQSSISGKKILVKNL